MASPRIERNTVSLAPHLYPQTYWEKRCALLEQSVQRLTNIISVYTFPPAGHEDLAEHFKEWNRLIGELANEHPSQASKGTPL